MGNSNKKGKNVEDEARITMDMLMMEENSDDGDDELLASSRNIRAALPAEERRMPIPSLPENYGFPAPSDVLDFDIPSLDKPSKSDRAKRNKIRRNPTLLKFKDMLEATKNAPKSATFEEQDEAVESDSLPSRRTVLEYDYNMLEIRSMFLENQVEDLKQALWDDPNRQHNWLKAVNQNEITETEETFDYADFEKELQIAYGQEDPKQAAETKDALTQMRKSMLAAQSAKVKSLKDQTKMMNLRIKQRIKDLEREKKRNLKETKRESKKISASMGRPRKKSRFSMQHIRKNSSRVSFKSKGKLQKSSKSSSNKMVEVTSADGASSYKDMFDDASSKNRAEVNELKLLKKTLITDIQFPGLLKWKVKSEVASGLYIGAKDIEVNTISADFHYFTVNQDGQKVLIFDVENLNARIGILELALKGNNNFTKALGGMVNPTVSRLYLILTGKFQVHMLYDELEATWTPLTKLCKFKLKIQKETKGVKNIRLPSGLINLLGNSVIPKIITNGFRDGLPQKLETFDEVFRAKVNEVFRKYGFSESSIRRMMHKESSFLTSKLTNIDATGSIHIEGDLDFNIWRAPLIAPTPFAAAARRALKLSSIEDAVQLDILLRSARAKRAGFPVKTAVTIEKLAVWRYKFGSYKLSELREMLTLLCGTQSGANTELLTPKALFAIFVQLEKLSKKPVNVNIKVKNALVTVNVLEFYQNLQQNYIKYTNLHGKNKREVDNAYEDVLQGLRRILKIVKLAGEGTGKLSLLSIGPLVAKDPSIPITGVDVDSTVTGVGDHFGGVMLKLENVQYSTRLNSFNEVKDMVEEERRKLNITTQAFERNETREYVLRFNLRGERQMVDLRRSVGASKGSRQSRPKQAIRQLMTSRSEDNRGHMFASMAELGICGAKVDLFSKKAAFGSVDLTSEMIQCYLDNSFWDALLDDGRMAPLYQRSATSEFVKNRIAPVLQRNGFRKLASIGGLKSLDILHQADILLRWLDGAIPYDTSLDKLGTTEMYARAASTYEYHQKEEELSNIPRIVQRADNEFAAHVNAVPFTLTSNGEVLSLTFSEDKNEGEDYAIQMRFRMDLADLLSRE